MNANWNSPEVRWVEWKADLDHHMVNDERDSSIIREYVQDYGLEALGMERYKHYSNSL